MKTYSRVYAKIDLDAVAWNMEQMKKNLKEGTEMVAVIKTDGYGHGAVQVASMLESYDYVWGYAVATLDEAVVLRAAEIQKPILVLGCIFPDQYWEMLKYEIRMNVYTKEMAEAISALAVEKGEQAYVHIKLDTGMARLGFSAEESSIEEIKEIAELPNLVLEGVFTHFAKADEEDKTFTMMQLEKFEWMTQRLEEEGVTFPYVHASNSAGIIDVRRADYNLVRAGIAIYGLYPSEEVDKERVQLKPALSLKSHIAFVKDIPAGTPVSYGGDFVSEHPMRINEDLDEQHIKAYVTGRPKDYFSIYQKMIVPGRRHRLARRDPTGRPRPRGRDARRDGTPRGPVRPVRVCPEKWPGSLGGIRRRSPSPRSHGCADRRSYVPSRRASRPRGRGLPVGSRRARR